MRHYGCSKLPDPQGVVEVGTPMRAFAGDRNADGL
jgi:hypothetical protein